MKMIEAKDICTAYLEGYFYAKIIVYLITGKIHSSDLDALKELAVKSMKDYIERSGFSYGVKESMKNNYEHWTDMTLLESSNDCVKVRSCLNKK